MATTQNNQRCCHCHYRSSSAPPFSSRGEEEHERVAITITTRDLETTIFDEHRRRKELLALRDAFSDFSSNFSKRALHFQSVRQNPTLRGFFDTTRDFDQELLDLKFQLAGPNRIYFLPEEDAENAIRCIRRTTAVLLSARWQIWRYVELSAVHAGREAGDPLVWSASLKKYVCPGKITAELECQMCFDKARPWLERLLGELRREVPRMRWIVGQLEGRREPSFIRDLKEAGPHSKAPKTSALLPFLSFGTRSGNHQYEMSGGLSTDKARMTPTWINNMMVRLEGRIVNDPAEVDFSAILVRIRYRELKAREKLQGGENLEAMRDAWVAFRDDLDKRTGAPSTDLILLRHKVITEMILSERRLQQAREQEGGASGEDGGAQVV
ncbi:hypothetical protein F5Y00DRAFT_273519 [Daldinia vernicosa]|uniref:uncharacterized protein n=1 Tax=Daldinia vernicosa TaxID=114800 RepID=UPI002008346B|nr:uncharacterized protein F5Y00DRAFT_273519 [Daldinia vernicosa]KAI0844845.1 hypothetical protein F5Y00DRAFT_273519 [Daldinia vernicosa]